jgi:uncharacterized protein YecE (DUF72 family)
MSRDIRIGISGWNYKPWRGVFYPAHLPHAGELSYAASRFQSVEVNGTFYSLKRPGDFLRWRAQTPEDFVFAIKGSRYITHMLKLKDPLPALANFFAQGLLALGPKLGPILWQFPASMRFDAERLTAFLRMLPRDTEAAQALARKHDARLNGRSHLEVDTHCKLRHAFEIRNESFRSAQFIRLLRRHRAALVCADTVEWPLLMDLTADFVYCRLHGARELYVSGYGPRALDRWSTRVRAWARGAEPRDAVRVLPATRPRARGRDVYVYFDNDAKVRAPADAGSLARKVAVR